MEKTSDWIIPLVAAIIGSLLIGSHIKELSCQRIAVEHGAAYYHPDTGAFTWYEKEKDDDKPIRTAE